MNTILAVAAGGALGALSRFYVMGWLGHALGTAFPWGTLAVNVLGSFLLGVAVEGAALAWTLSPEARAFIAVGFMGAFTTFSTFSMDAVLLIERGAVAAAAAYMVASVVLCVGGFFAARLLVRQVL